MIRMIRLYFNGIAPLLGTPIDSRTESFSVNFLSPTEKYFAPYGKRFCCLRNYWN